MSNVELLGYQYEFLTSQAKETLLLGGVGSGKSTAGSHFAIGMCSKYPKVKGLIVANTYTQLMNATVEAFLAELDLVNIPYHAVLSGAKKHIQIGATKIYLYSLEKYDNIRGIETGWVFGDEILFSKEEALKVVRGRVRAPNAPLLLRWTSSPNGFNFGYDKFENMDGANKTDRVHLVRAKTKENLFLPDGYYEDLLEDYGGIDNPLAQQELEGQFVNLQAGAIYWAFDRGKHVGKVERDKDFIVDVGQDFNIDNMCSVYVQRKQGHYYVSNEVVLSEYGANTDNAASNITTDLKNYRKRVVPDSTGKSRKTSASSGQTDIQILESYGLEVMTTRNPFIRDRQNTLNILFKKNRITIDPSCKTLIKELEILSARDKEGDKAHVAVALGYVAWKFDPLIRGSENRLSLGRTN